MILEDIVRRTDRVFRLKPRHWAWARLLGEARTASNDARRAPRSDRGRSNARVDLFGALGELFLLRTAMAAENSGDATAYMRDHLYREEGGGGVDVSSVSCCFPESVPVCGQCRICRRTRCKGFR